MKLDAQTQAWALLLLAGLFEVGFTTFMTLQSKGYKLAFAGFLVCAVVSFTLLEQATRTIPMGIGYAVWTGIGAVGTLLVSALVFRAAISPAQMGFIALMIVSMIGLKLTGASH